MASLGIPAIAIALILCGVYCFTNRCGARVGLVRGGIVSPDRLLEARLAVRTFLSDEDFGYYLVRLSDGEKVFLCGWYSGHPYAWWTDDTTLRLKVRLSLDEKHLPRRDSAFGVRIEYEIEPG